MLATAPVSELHRVVAYNETACHLAWPVIRKWDNHPNFPGKTVGIYEVNLHRMLDRQKEYVTGSVPDIIDDGELFNRGYIAWSQDVPLLVRVVTESIDPKDDILVAMQYSSQVIDHPDACKEQCDDMHNIVTPSMTGPLDECKASEEKGTAFEKLENIHHNAQGHCCFNLGSSTQVQKGGRQGPVSNMRAEVKNPESLNIKTRLNKVRY